MSRRHYVKLKAASLRLTGTLHTAREVPDIDGVRFIEVDDADLLLVRYDPGTDTVVPREAADFEGAPWSPAEGVPCPPRIRSTLEAHVAQLDIARARAHRAAND